MPAFQLLTSRIWISRPSLANHASAITTKEMELSGKHRPMATRLKNMKYAAAFSMAANLCALILPAISTQAAPIAITYSYEGIQTGPDVTSGTTVTLSHLLNGSVFSANPVLNTALDPFTGQDHDVLDLTTFILTGSVTYLFANGEQLFGSQYVTGLDTDNNQVQSLTFTGGTGEFAGATGSASGTASLTDTGYIVSGSGVINTAAVPEPVSAALCLTGLGIMGALLRSNLSKRQKAD